MKNIPEQTMKADDVGRLRPDAFEYLPRATSSHRSPASLTYPVDFLVQAAV